MEGLSLLDILSEGESGFHVESFDFELTEDAPLDLELSDILLP
jgi:hypothetical protein